jgi:hypothetical protein
LLCPQALESPLLVAVAAGSVALPTLLKLSDVLAAQKQDLSIGHQLPVEVELGKVRSNLSSLERVKAHTASCFRSDELATWS